jgi:hypothetical protein
MLKIKTALSPTLAAGAFTQNFGEFNKVNSAMVTSDIAATGGNSFQYKATISGNVVTVTVYLVALTQATDANRVYAAATTGDVSGATFTILADGE